MRILLDEFENLKFLDTYIGSGKSLNDKDRNINEDLKEIHDFFEPIDRLYGDYESRKKIGVQEGLYRRNLNNQVVNISVSELEEKRKEVPDSVIIFRIFKFGKNYYIEYKLDNIKNILKCGIIFDYETKGVNINAELVSELILDPVKIYQTLALDNERNEYFCQMFWDKYLNDFEKDYPEVKTVPIEIADFIQSYAVLLNFAKRYQRLIILNYNKIDIFNRDFSEIEKLANNKEFEGLYDKNGENLEIIKNAIKKVKNDIINDQIAKKIIDNLEKEKLKNFEKFSKIKIRLGQYASGRLVLFLHPYESESNNPIRIPSE